MPPQIQQSLLTQATQHIKLDLGLGMGKVLVFKHLPKEIQHGELVFGRGDKKSQYDVGLRLLRTTIVAEKSGRNP